MPLSDFWSTTLGSNTSSIRLNCKVSIQKMHRTINIGCCFKTHTRRCGCCDKKEVSVKVRKWEVYLRFSDQHHAEDTQKKFFWASVQWLTYPFAFASNPTQHKAKKLWKIKIQQHASNLCNNTHNLLIFQILIFAVFPCRPIQQVYDSDCHPYR